MDKTREIIRSELQEYLSGGSVLSDDNFSITGQIINSEIIYDFARVRYLKKRIGRLRYWRGLLEKRQRLIF